MSEWILTGGPDSLRLARGAARREFGDEAITWAKLLYASLAQVEVFVIFFPSRFDLPADKSTADLLRAFGKNTPTTTSVNFWDPRDEKFTTALQLFGLQAPPAVVLATGLRLPTVDPQGPADSNLYSISLTDAAILTNPQSLVKAVNVAHEVLAKADAGEIKAAIRSQNVDRFLAAVGRVATAIRDQLVALKPKVGLPGGASISVG